LYSFSYVNALVNKRVDPYHAKKRRVNAMIYWLFRGVSINRGCINPIKTQKIKVMTVISNFCNGVR
jgi:hypothetical protein